MESDEERETERKKVLVSNRRKWRRKKVRCGRISSGVWSMESEGGGESLNQAVQCNVDEQNKET